MKEYADLSDTGLIKVLDNMMASGTITKELLKKGNKLKPVYVLTRQGREEAKNEWTIAHDVIDLMGRLAEYYYNDYHELTEGYSYGWIDSNPPISHYKLADSVVVEKMSRILAKDFKQKIIANKSKLESDKAGKLIVFFEVDCKRMIEKLQA